MLLPPPIVIKNMKYQSVQEMGQGRSLSRQSNLNSFKE
ncbi:hypothetical protein B224_3057 [Aeromonas media WS]|nr:hypothetical protein B224_3057 [Aeromonas media WS]